MVDMGTFEYWQADEEPVAPPLGQDSGSFEYWQADEQPPVLSGGKGAAAVPFKGWGWGFAGIG